MLIPGLAFHNLFFIKLLVGISLSKARLRWNYDLCCNDNTNNTMQHLGCTRISEYSLKIIMAS